MARPKNYYDSTWWKQRRLEILAKFPNCYICKRPANVGHHRHYNTCGKEADKDLITLCEDHHNALERGIMSGCWSRMHGHSELKVAIDNDDKRKLKLCRLAPNERAKDGCNRRKAIFSKPLTALRRQLTLGKFLKAEQTLEEISSLISKHIGLER